MSETKKTVVILVGLRGVGKTTYRRRMLPEYVVVEAPNDDEAALYQALQGHDRVVVDDCNPTPQDREKWIALAKLHGARVEAHMIEASRSAIVPGVGLVFASYPWWDEGIDQIVWVEHVTDGYKIHRTRDIPRSGVTLPG